MKFLNKKILLIMKLMFGKKIMKKILNLMKMKKKIFKKNLMKLLKKMNI